MAGMMEWPNRRQAGLIQKIRLFADDQIPKGLILEPADAGIANLLLSYDGALMRDRPRFSGCFRHQLCLAAAIHRDEEPCCFVDGASYCQNSVILQDDGLPMSQ